MELVSLGNILTIYFRYTELSSNIRFIEIESESLCSILTIYFRYTELSKYISINLVLSKFKHYIYRNGIGKFM